MSAETVCVVGCGGFVGSHVTAELLSRGYDVHGTLPDSAGEKATWLMSKVAPSASGANKLSLFSADVYDKSSLEPAMAGCNGAIVCAGSPVIEPETIDLMLAVAENVSNAAIEAQIGRAVFTSSTGSTNPPEGEPELKNEVEHWSDPNQQLERVRHRQNQKGDSQGSQKVIQAMIWVKGGQPWMTRPYSEDLRERVVRVVESGTSRNAAAKQFDVSISFVVKLMQRWKQRGTIKADKYGGWKKSKLAPHGDRIRALVMENCDITIDELCVLLAAEGIEAKRSTLGDFLLAQGLSRKKRQPTPPSRSALTSRRREPLGATSNLG